jgi:hypothetical protein
MRNVRAQEIGKPPAARHLYRRISDTRPAIDTPQGGIVDPMALFPVDPLDFRKPKTLGRRILIEEAEKFDPPVEAQDIERPKEAAHHQLVANVSGSVIIKTHQELGGNCHDRCRVDDRHPAHKQNGSAEFNIPQAAGPFALTAAGLSRNSA